MCVRYSVGKECVSEAESALELEQRQLEIVG